MPIEPKLSYQKPAFILVTCVVTGLFVGGATPQAANLFDVPFDKVAHVVTYSFITLLLWLSFSHRKIVFSVLGAILVAISDESYQLFLAGREADLFDLAADISAIGVTGLLLYLIYE